MPRFTTPMQFKVVRDCCTILLFGLRWIIGVLTGRMVTVRIFHNVATDADGRRLGFSGYEPDHPVVEVWRLPAHSHADVLDVCDGVWELLNIGDDPTFGPPDIRALGYRARGNRSLSVRDCLAIADRYFAVSSTGWKPIAPPRQTTDGLPGSTYLWAPDPPGSRSSPGISPDGSSEENPQ